MASPSSRTLEELLRQWDPTWCDELLDGLPFANPVAVANELNRRIASRLHAIGRILYERVSRGNFPDWDSIAKSIEKRKPQAPLAPKMPPEPAGDRLPLRPNPRAPEYQAWATFRDIFDLKRWHRKVQQAKERYSGDLRVWHEDVVRMREHWAQAVEAKRSTYECALEAYHVAMRKWQRLVEQVEDYSRGLQGGASPRIAEDYISFILETTSNPITGTPLIEVSLAPSSNTAIVDYGLPAPADMPIVESIKAETKKNTTTLRPKKIGEKRRSELYDSLLHQICLRTVFEVFAATGSDAVAAVTFNGWVTSLDPATGKEATACILSLHASRDEIEERDLLRVDPTACFRGLKGVGAARLSGLTPVAPLMSVPRGDSRFVPSRAVAEQMDAGTNLAAMDWEDFEHLIREVFEAEFARRDGEVKITRASRDSGVDAVAFDPDPIAGGKIVIQAKRYTNLVGVTAVRDLFGTVHNEGANKGILVTTSGYGPDAYQFAKGKPLTLLDGANLLHLLARHGYRARIDINEAKRLQQER